MIYRLRFNSTHLSFRPAASNPSSPPPRNRSEDRHAAESVLQPQREDSHRELPTKAARMQAKGDMNDIIEQDHRFIKERIAASFGFRSAEGWRDCKPYNEAI